LKIIETISERNDDGHAKICPGLSVAKFDHKAKIMLGLVKNRIWVKYRYFLDECIDNLTADVETMDEDSGEGNVSAYVG